MNGIVPIILRVLFNDITWHIAQFSIGQFPVISDINQFFAQIKTLHIIPAFRTKLYNFLFFFNLNCGINQYSAYDALLALCMTPQLYTFC